MRKRRNKSTDQEPVSGESMPERVYAFSDGVFAIIITIMVLELKRPATASFQALFELWPTWLSYVVSYVFIAIVWVNHHFLLKHVKVATLRLIWGNFAHLFSVSLIPFLTDWIAETRLESVPVVMYALVFLLVNATYFWLSQETLHGEDMREMSPRSGRLHRIRSIITLSLFGMAMIIAFWFPYIGFGLICCCLVLYLRPELPAKNITI